MAQPRQHSEEALVAKFVDFLLEIGISVEYGVVRSETFLPGIQVSAGGLLIDKDELKYPGDILHEAGHLAVAPKDLRPELNGEVVIPGENPTTIEAAAMCWSYAACLHLDVDPRVVFHDAGYRGRSAGILQCFAFGLFPGLHKLVSFGMTADSGEPSDALPIMRRWLRE
jgi:hypothetical protein